MTTEPPVLAPRCRLHRPPQPNDCPRCRARRSSQNRLYRYQVRSGTWVGLQPAGPVIAHCKALHAAKLSYQQQATLSGIRYSHLLKIVRGVHQRLNATTVAALLALEAPSDPTWSAISNRVDGTGTRRRLRGMACDGFGFGYIARRLGVTRQAIQHHSRAEQVLRTTAEKIAALADELEGLTGPDGISRSHAEREKWVPLSAWGVDIDDPDAVPDIADPDSYVDDVKVDRACAGRYPADQLTGAERVAAVRRLAGRRLNDKEIAVLMQWTTAAGAVAWSTVAACRNRNGIPSGYQQGRGVRFDQARVDAALRGELGARDLWPAERHAAVVALVGEGLTDREIGARLRWSEDPDRATSAVQTFRHSRKIRAGRPHPDAVAPRPDQLDLVGVTG